jgi:hypothetical protein
MATRSKTVVYAFPTLTTATTDAVVTNLAQITIYIPETVISFQSVFVEVGFQDIITVTGGTITEHRCGLRLGAAGYTTITETDDIANTGENMGGILGPFDFTSHFTTNWTGTSMTCDVQVYFDQTTGTTLGMRNVTAIVYCTYTYDDDDTTNPTQIKTVRIPLESLVGALTTTTNSQIGSNQIPILTGGSGILPEASITIRDYAFIIEANTSNNNTVTDFTVSCNIDSGASFSFGATEAALGSDYFTRLIYKPTVPTTTSAHAFQMWSSVANKMNMSTITLFVTYEFDASSTTRVLNSILFPIELASPLGYTTSAEASRYYREFNIEDPGTITLRQSSFRIHFNTTAAISGLNFRAGAQAFRTYTHIANACCGMFLMQQRIDSGSAQGAGISIARGLNTINIDAFTTDTVDQATNVSGLIILNYESDIGSGGIGQNSHSILQVLYPWNALLADYVRINSYSIAIPETSYRLQSVGFCMIQWIAAAANAVTLDVEILSGENKNAGYLDIYTDAYQSDAERSCSVIWMSGRDVFKRFPTDPDNSRLDIETARDYRSYNSASCGIGILSLITYHSFTFTISGTLSGFTGDGSGISVDIFKASTREWIGTTTTAIGGTYSFDWYDNVDDVYTVARQSSILLGRSDDGPAA